MSRSVEGAVLALVVFWGVVIPTRSIASPWFMVHESSDTSSVVGGVWPMAVCGRSDLPSFVGGLW